MRLCVMCLVVGGVGGLLTTHRCHLAGVDSGLSTVCGRQTSGGDFYYTFNMNFQ